MLCIIIIIIIIIIIATYLLKIKFSVIPGLLTKVPGLVQRCKESQKR